MDGKQKKLIDNMTYSDMLYRNRFAPIGDELFQDECGAYFMKVMDRKKAKLSNAETVRISKNIGWGE